MSTEQVPTERVPAEAVERISAWHPRRIIRLAIITAVVAILTVACGVDRSDAQSRRRGGACRASTTTPLTEPPGDIAPVGAPEWQFSSAEETFSSPRLADLDGDGVLDVVIGLGQDTFGARASSLVAIDGATGLELWRSTGHEDLVGSGAFVDLDGDGASDVVIGGRRGALIAVAGRSGDLLWRFDDEQGRWFNFYTPTPVRDVDGDGVSENVASTGGLVIDEPEEGAGLLPVEEKRLVGRIFLLSGADGSVISSRAVPDGRESYMSTLVIEPGGAEPTVLFGTGGETLPGTLWAASLVDWLAAPVAEVVAPRALLPPGDKGVIAVPSLTAGPDCPFDVVVQGFDGTLTALDFESRDAVWSLANPGFETYSSPTLGFFVGDDDVVDVFAAIAHGVWPQYDYAEHLVVDGSTGDVVWRWRGGTFAPSGFLAVDLDGDGDDEVVFGVNDISDNTHAIQVLDVDSGALSEIAVLSQTSFSAPWVGDMDGDELVDLVLISSAYHQPGSTVVERHRLDRRVPEAVTWGGYLGTAGDGRIATSPSAP